MQTPTHFKFALAVAALMSLPAAQAASMTQAEHSAAKARIETAYKADTTSCASQAGNAKDVCIEEAKGREEVGLAELTAAQSGSPEDRNKVLVVKTETAYAVAKEKCDALAGDARAACLGEADAKFGKKS